MPLCLNGAFGRVFFFNCSGSRVHGFHHIFLNGQSRKADSVLLTLVRNRHEEERTECLRVREE